jgi:hypothetical protein
LRRIFNRPQAVFKGTVTIFYERVKYLPSTVLKRNSTFMLLIHSMTIFYEEDFYLPTSTSFALMRQAGDLG